MEYIVFLIHYIHYSLTQNGIHLPEHYNSDTNNILDGYIIYWTVTSYIGRLHTILDGYIIYWTVTSYIGRLHHILDGYIIYWTVTSYIGRLHNILDG